MEQHDIAAAHLLRGAVHQILNAPVFPIQGIHAPLDHLVALRPGGEHHLVVVIPIGRAEQPGTRAGEGLGLVAHGFQLLGDFFRAQLAHLGMRGGMIADLVAPGGDLLHQLGKTLRPDVHQEKGGFHLVFIQDVQNFAGFVPAPGRVKADGDFLIRPVHAIDGQLPLPRHHLRAADGYCVQRAQGAKQQHRRKRPRRSSPLLPLLPRGAFYPFYHACASFLHPWYAGEAPVRSDKKIPAGRLRIF